MPTMLNLEQNADLSRLNTLGLAARAQHLLQLDTHTPLEQVSETAAEFVRCRQPVRVLGGGSNVVLAQHLPGLTIKVQTRGIQLLAQTAHERIVQAQAGENWHGLVQHCLARGWPGLENLALIPGTVGAAPVQNIGAYGVELAQRFHSLLAWDLQAGRQVEMGVQDCRFGYRDSVFKQATHGRWLIVAVRLRLPVAWRAVLDYPDLQRHPLLQATEPCPQDVFDAVCAIRRSKLSDPAVLPNAGSFFKNPVVAAEVCAQLTRTYPDLPAHVQPDGTYKLAAGWLIERSGWKGKRLGPVGMHARQALVLVNHGGAKGGSDSGGDGSTATAADVLALAAQVQAEVARCFGIRLEQEPVVFD